MVNVLRPLTPNEEVFLRKFLAESHADWVNGDLFRGWTRKLFLLVDELRAEAAAVRDVNLGLAERVAEQSELLTRRAEK